MSIDQFVTATRKGIRFSNRGLSFQSGGINITATPSEVDNFNPQLISAAHYTVLSETKSGQKETVNINLVASSAAVYFTVFGRINFGTDLVSVTAEIEQGLVSLKLSTTESNVKVSLIKQYSESIKF